MSDTNFENHGIPIFGTWPSFERSDGEGGQLRGGTVG